MRFLLHSIIAMAFISTAAVSAQDVDVRVFPVAHGTPVSDELFPTIQMALDLTTQSRTATDQPTGYVFLRARITAADLDDQEFFLGRPWRHTRAWSFSTP